MSALRTVPALFLDRVERWSERIAFRSLAAGGAPVDEATTWEEWGRRARGFAGVLLRSGLEPGDGVAVWAGNRPVWPVADTGTLLAGGVAVGIYPTSAPVQVRHVLEDSEARIVVVDTPERLRTVRALRPALPRLERIVDASGDGWAAHLEEGRRALAVDPDLDARLGSRAAASAPDDVALLIYTSGSTGVPRGARISHRTVIASAGSVRDTLGLTEEDTTLSFLPFCHAAERIFGLYTRILCGIEFALVEDHRRIFEAARAYRPTLFGGLPRFYEKIHEALLAREAALDGPEREAWAWGVELGRERSRLRRAGREVPPELERGWREAASAVVEAAAEHLGGRVRLATSGGAALPVEVAEHLDAAGITVLGAYGLTEHLCAAFNRPESYGFDSAGPAMPGTEIRIAADGEILLRRSALTFSGYHGRPAESREAFTPDGEWLRTGDLGRLDGRGFLAVTGRKKELIALSTGKKVPPLPIESRLAEDPWISQAVVHGEGRKFLSALLALRRPVVEAWARERGLAGSWESLLRRPEVRERLASVVGRVNADLSRTERVRRFDVLERELTLEADELTPTLKIRRPVVEERYRGRLDALYGADPDGVEPHRAAERVIREVAP